MALDEAKLARLEELAAQGVPSRQIARELGISKTYAHKLITKLALGVRVQIKRGLQPDTEAGRFVVSNAGKFSDSEMAKACGVTRHQVRKFREKHKLATFQYAPKLDPKPFALETRFVAANDRELIDEFMSRKGATVCPPGTACGLSAIERYLYAAKPPSKDYTAWMARKAARAAR